MNNKTVEQETIDTRIGELEFEHGFPANRQTVTTLYDEMDFQRATQAYLWAVPAVSFQSFQTGFFRSGVDYNDVVIFDNFLDTKTLAVTGTDSTIYALSLIDLAKDGPVVIEVPPGPRPALSTIIGSAPRRSAPTSEALAEMAIRGARPASLCMPTAGRAIVKLFCCKLLCFCYLTQLIVKLYYR